MHPAVRCGAVRCGGVVWCGVAWRGVAWRDTVCVCVCVFVFDIAYSPTPHYVFLMLIAHRFDKWGATPTFVKIVSGPCPRLNLMFLAH